MSYANIYVNWDDESFFSEDIRREYDCYEVPCGACKECEEAYAKKKLYTECPVCGRAIQPRPSQYTCTCGCIIESCSRSNSVYGRIPIVAGFAIKGMLLHDMEVNEDTI